MLDRLSRTDRLTGGGAVLGLLGTLLPWYHFDDGPSRVTANGFGSGFLGDVVFLCAAAMLGVLLVRRGYITLRRELEGPRIDRVLGGGALAAVVLQLLIGVNGSGAFHSATIGIAVALAAAALMAAGAWSHTQEVPARHNAFRRR